MFEMSFRGDFAYCCISGIYILFSEIFRKGHRKAYWVSFSVTIPLRKKIAPFVTIMCDLCQMRKFALAKRVLLRAKRY